MAVIDKLLAAAKRPDCIMAVFPYQGGIWASPLGGASGVDPIPGSATTGSWAVRNGLLKYNNMEIRDGVFSEKDPSVHWWIDTPLDLRETEIDYTFIARCKVNNLDFSNINGFAIPLFTQGHLFVSSIVYRLFNIFLRAYSTGNCAFMCLFANNSQEDFEWAAWFGKSQILQWATYAFTIKYMDGIITTKFFIDGVQVGDAQLNQSSSGLSGNPTGESFDGNRVQLANAQVNNMAIVQTQTQYQSWMIFNRAMSDEEIKALS